MCEAARFGDCMYLGFSLGSVTLNESLGLGGPYFRMCKTNPMILGAVRVKRAMYVKSILHWEVVL